LLSAPFWSGVAAIVVSSEPKARLTAEPAAARFGLPIYVDARLDELRRGAWIEDNAATVAQPLAAPQVSVRDWESAASALSRAQEALAAWQAKFGTGELAVVGHGISLSLVRAWILGRSHVDIHEWQTLPFGAWATVDFQKQKIIRDFVFGDSSR
jgi:broad specificity phosphatase PhoE